MGILMLTSSSINLLWQLAFLVSVVITLFLWRGQVPPAFVTVIPGSDEACCIRDVCHGSHQPRVAIQYLKQLM